MTDIKLSEQVKRAFLTGLAALFPILITIFLLSWLYTQMDKVVGSKVNALGQRTLVSNERLFDIAFPSAPEDVSADSASRREYVDENYPHSIGGLVGIIGVVFAVLLVGFILRGFIGAKIVRRIDAFFESFPVIKSIYPHARQVADFLFGTRDKLEFKRVIAVQYPRKGIYSLGFLTGYGLKDIREQAGQNLVSVFIPNSPAPLTGFVIMVPKNETIDLDMRVEEAIRFCVTAGMIGGQREQMEEQVELIAENRPRALPVESAERETKDGGSPDVESES